MTSPARQQKFGRGTATSIVIANMIGTGVFTSLGFQLVDIRSAPVILLLWIVGGVLALCGALAYAELGSALPRSGGEYNFLGRIYHPAAGFISGWISSTIGFAAPTALAAITSATYLASVFPGLSVPLLAAGLVIAVSAMHLGTRRSSGGFQFGVTAIKVLCIIAFMVMAVAWVEVPQNIRWLPASGDLDLALSGGFAIALIFVNYAYTGWNAATYLSDEVDDAARNLPRILLVGTGSVTVIYVLLHVVFLYVAPMEAIAGQLEVGYIVADFAFGEVGSNIVGLMLSVLLVSTISAMVLAGPRALQAIGQDCQPLGFLAKENRHGIPYRAIIFQVSVTVALVLTSTFEAILVFAGFTLALNTLLAVCGVVVLRRRRKPVTLAEHGLLDPNVTSFRMPFYPLPVVVFAGFTLWTSAYVVWLRPQEALMSAVLILGGWLFYLVTRDRVSRS